MGTQGFYKAWAILHAHKRAVKDRHMMQKSIPPLAHSCASTARLSRPEERWSQAAKEAQWFKDKKKYEDAERREAGKQRRQRGQQQQRRRKVLRLATKCDCLNPDVTPLASLHSAGRGGGGGGGQQTEQQEGLQHQCRTTSTEQFWASQSKEARIK